MSDAEIDAMSKIPGFALAQRFYALNLRLEGNREWNWPLRGMTDRQLLAAAEYGKRVELLDRTVNTADRTKAEHDFTLRYPSPYRNIVERYAQSTGLDTEWAYGLIRQESRFIISARSSVGAGGLMQLMPATAQMVAKKLGMGTISRAQMHDIDTNIQLGTWYLADIYNNFDSSPVLATAGYNAPGPAAPVAPGVDAAGRRRDLRRNDSVQRDARLREERAVEHRLLRGALRGQTAVVEETSQA